MGVPETTLVSPEGGPAKLRPGSEQWKPWTAVLAVAVALFCVFLAVVLIYAIFSAAGIDTDGPGVNLSLQFAQDVIFVATAFVFAGSATALSLRDFGFRRFKASAVLWVLLAFVVYILIAWGYSELVTLPEEDLPKELGAESGTAFAVAAGIVIVGIAPLTEEFFFRGYVYASLRNGIGVFPAALASGAIFGLLHFEPLTMVPLTALGVVLALLYERTGSLWPSIGLHAVNNAIAYSAFFEGK